MALWSKALHLSARGVITDPGLIPGCITTGHDWAVALGGLQLAQRSPGEGLAGLGHHCK